MGPCACFARKGSDSAAAACRFYNATLAIDVVGINQYISIPQAGEKAGLIRIPLGYSGMLLLASCSSQ